MRSVRNCNVAVVGGAGFLGSHLVNHLVEDRNCRVLVLDNLCVGKREWVHKKANFVYCDITQSEDFLRKVFHRERIQYVFNYAAHPYIPDSFARPKHVFEVNATGAINVINAAQEAGCEGILQVSSAELYGEGTRPPEDWNKSQKLYQIDEEDEVKPHSTYGAAKAAVDYYCQTAWRERKTPVIALRQFNCCGERETHPYIVPEIISQLSQIRSNDSLGRVDDIIAHVKLGNNSFRDFLYAGDAVRIAVELLERGQWGEVYNLGSETGIKMYDLAKLIGKLMGFTEVKVVEDESRKRPWEIWHLLSDNTKLWEALKGAELARRLEGGLIPLEESLKRTIRWYEENGRKWLWEKQHEQPDLTL